MPSSVIVKDRIPEYQARSLSKARAAIKQMAAQILQLSKRQVPYDTGRLSSSSGSAPRQVGADTYEISYATPYARWWEFNQTHPRYGTPVVFQHGRKSHYLRDPAMLVAGNAGAYFRDALT